MNDFEEYNDEFTSDITEDDFEKESNNKKVKLNTNNIIIAILIFIIIILLFIIFSRGKCDKCETKKEDVKEEEKTTTKKEEGLSDETKEEIASKLATLFSDGSYEYGNLIQNNDIENYVANIFEDTLDDESKAILILRSLNSETVELDWNNANFSDASLKETLQEADGKSVVYDAEEFKEKYYEVFGIEPTLTDYTKSCPSYYYESNENVYVEKNGCQNTATLNTYIYINDITENQGSIVVDAYVGAHRSSNTGEYYYDDYEYPKVKNNKTEQTTITDENKTSFTNYKFTFTKNSNGEYNFTSVEKVK